MAKKRDNTKLTAKQQRFVEEYLVDCNATQAAIRAGYSPHNAGKIGPELVGKTRISEAIAAGMQRLAHKLEIKAETVLEEMARLAFSDIGDALDDEGRVRAIKDIPVAGRRAIAGIKIKRYREGRGEEAPEVEVTELKLWDKNSALEKLAKCLKLFASEDEGRFATVIHTIEVRLAGGETV